MRFLHTADWHLGKTLRGRSRIDEQEAVLAEILDICAREKVDALLMCGDLFDSYAPSPEAEKLAFNFFAELIGRGTPAVVIGGNHDHPRRLAALRRLLDPLRIYIRPEPARPQEGGVICLDAGGERACLAVLPFVSERKIVDAVQLIGPEPEQYACYEERVGAMCEALCSGFGHDTVNLLLSHLYVKGSEACGSERAVHLSQPYEVPAQRLPSSAHYIALGHLHRPQHPLAPSPAAYAGSILQFDFGEQGQDKRVVLVEARAGSPAATESIPLTAGRRLREISGTLQEIEAVEVSGEEYLRVVVEVAAPVPGLAQRVREQMPEAIDIRIEYPRVEEAGRRPSLENLSPDALFVEYYRAQHGAVPSQALLNLYRRVYQEALDASD